ncbi:MAG: serine/threonine protein kinase [Planctomycetota bacterium]|nr:MAG: serine/threonine protein kinase [Planctomycetota bacterium]
MSDELLLFGKIALKNNLMTDVQLQQALKFQEELRQTLGYVSLGEVCVKMGFLSREDVQKILEVQRRKEIRDQSKLYGQIALKNRFISQEQLDECLKEQASSKVKRPLGHYLLKKGYIEERVHRSILRSIERLRQKKGEASSRRVAVGNNNSPGGPSQQSSPVSSLKCEGEKDRKPSGKISPTLARLVPGYRIIEKIGQGAMGVVYKAVQESMGKLVAIKVLPNNLEDGEQRKQRFIREAQSLGKLQHPNIIRAIDMGESKGHLYYVMEYVEGTTLDHLIEKKGALEERQALEFVRDIASALEHAWEFRIVHRDIKPENMLLSKGGQIKLCDLGLVKCLSDDRQLKLTMDGTTVGTPLYMSPEQAKAEEIDIRSDIYSLGASLYHMVVGAPPFEHKSMVIVMQMHVLEPVPFAQERNRRVSADTSRLIQKMMEKSPRKRFQLPGEVVEAIERILQGGSFPSQKSLKFSKGLKKWKSSFRRRR